MTPDTVAVYLLRFLKNKFGRRPRKIYYFSDGCAGQYKNCKNVLNICQHLEDFGMEAEWNFFATSHGKGPCDGVRGTIKRMATKASLQRPFHDQIQTPHRLYRFAKDSIPVLEVEYFTIAHWQAEQDFLEQRFLMVRTMPGTRHLHFQPVSKAKVLVQEFSQSTKQRRINQLNRMSFHLTK
ncbi:UNVERIFIED_CONTAM: hypothetical protein FKN15_006659 [Acipenser sinensis]